MDDQPAIEFIGTVRQIKTLVDGGMVFIFDAPETAISQAAQLIAVRNAGIVLKIRCTADGFNQKHKDKEILSIDQQIQKTQKEIEELESDFEFTE